MLVSMIAPLFFTKSGFTSTFLTGVVLRLLFAVADETCLDFDLLLFRDLGVFDRSYFFFLLSSGNITLLAIVIVFFNSSLFTILDSSSISLSSESIFLDCRRCIVLRILETVNMCIDR